MIEPDVFQAALIALLQGDTDLTDELAEGAAGVREAEWHSTAFSYPCVRVRRSALSPYGNGNCSHRMSNAAFEVTVLSKRDSSITIQQIQALVSKALEGQVLDTADLRTISIRTTQVGPAQPQPENDGIWIGSLAFRTVVIER